MSKNIPLDDSVIKKSGGIVNGGLSVEGTLQHIGRKIVTEGSTNGGSSGYVKLCTFTILNTRPDSVIKMEVTRRHNTMPSIFYIKFENLNSTDPSLEYLQHVGEFGCYMHKSATSTWDLYIQKSESWDNNAILDFSFGGSSSGKISVSFVRSFASSLPSGYISSVNISPINVNNFGNYVFPAGARATVYHANDATATGLYVVPESSDTTNMPVSGGNGFLLVFNTGVGFILQIFVLYNGYTWVRTYWSSWRDWRALH